MTSALQSATTIRTGSHLSLVELPTEVGVEELHNEIADVDAAILELVLRRNELSQQVGETVKATGASQVSNAREMEALKRFDDLGAEGKALAMLMLRVGRGVQGR